MLNMLPPSIKALVLDMDGVLWVENEPLGDLPAIFAFFRKKNLRLCLATNNSTRTPNQYLQRLEGYGVRGLTTSQILTSSQTLTQALNLRFPRRGLVYAIGEAGLQEALLEQGYTLAGEDEERDVIAVAVGMDRQISFAKLRRATLHIRNGVPFFATNPDRTFPTPYGIIPGAGSLVAALVAATDVEPVFTGKPEPYMIEIAIQRMKASKENTLVVGDRLETDIAAGQAAGCRTALVLSGVTTREQAESWKPKVDLIIPDLASLIH